MNLRDVIECLNDYELRYIRSMISMEINSRKDIPCYQIKNMSCDEFLKKWNYVEISIVNR